MAGRRPRGRAGRSAGRAPSGSGRLAHAAGALDPAAGGVSARSPFVGAALPVGLAACGRRSPPPGAPLAAGCRRGAASANAAPVAALAAPATVAAGAPATFDAAGSSDPEGEALRFAFDLDGDGTYEFDGGQNPLALRSFPAPGTYTVGVRVVDPRGAAATAVAGITVTPAARPVPQPVLGRQGVATPKRGIVLVRLPGTKKFVPITDVSAIPNGTEIDARKGRVLLTVLHDASGRLDGAVFYAGRFIFNQGGGKTPITTLRLSGGSFTACSAKEARPGRAVDLLRRVRRASRAGPARSARSPRASCGATGAAGSAPRAATARRRCAARSG